MAGEDISPETGSTAIQPQEAKGFFKLDTVSLLLLAVTVLGGAATFVPVVMSVDAELFGLPWLFVMQPTVMVGVSLLFLLATYYVDTVVEDKEVR